MTDYTELIRQLKTYEDGYGLYADAAAAIEALEAEVKRLKMHCADCEYGNSPWPEEPGHEPKRGEWKKGVHSVVCPICGSSYEFADDVFVEDLDMDEDLDMRYCPKCGSDNAAKTEVQE